MKNCMECGYNFAFFDNFKILFNLRGTLTCPKCKSIYRDNFNFYRGIYYGLVSFVARMIYSEVNLSNHGLKVVLFIITNFSVLILFDIIPHKLHNYKKVN